MRYEGHAFVVTPRFLGDDDLTGATLNGFRESRPLSMTSTIELRQMLTEPPRHGGLEG